MEYFKKILSIIIVLILIYNIYISNKIVNDMLEGLWESTEEFCHDSKIDGMLLYIGPALSSFWINRKVYLIMYANDAIIINKKFNISNSCIINPFIQEKINLTFFLEDDKKADEVLDDESITDESIINIKTIMPTEQSVEINIPLGKMIWKNNDVVYADFTKNYSY